ncbi:MAG TPA: FxLYD domain-containing protein, partial [Nitrososphaeraceae archaeon]|nr:FxLYD domain-containing protein [Nitrososphaeraceae archaeon]
ANLKLDVGDSYYDSIDSAHVVGEVTNNGPGVSHYTKISGTFHDDQNKTVATGFTYTDPNDLELGQSAPFDMIISDDASANMASGSLNAQSSEYAMILPTGEFEMNGQSDGDSPGGFGSVGGGPINGSPDGGDDGDNGDDGGDGDGFFAGDSFFD